MTKQKILLTGGSGMVGKNFLEHAEINKYDILAPSSLELDLRSYQATENLIKYFKPNLILHAAGKVGGIRDNINYPVDYLSINLDIGKNIVLASRACGVKKLINLGSSCMYPRNGTQPLCEEQILKGELEPTNEGYALAKVMTAKLCEYINREDKSFNYKTLIPCNLYGKYDKFAPEKSHLIPAIIQKINFAIKNKHNEIEIWGDGNARREFMYAEDLCDALMHAINNYENTPEYINIGLGIDYTINEYYQIVGDIMNYEGKFTHDINKPVGMLRKIVDITKQKSWGWSAKHSLSSGIAKTYKYYLEECCHEF